MDAVLDVRDVYLDAALGAVHQEFGSIERYLEDAAGLAGTRREQLRDRLLA